VCKKVSKKEKKERKGQEERKRVNAKEREPDRDTNRM
jgi:hypothetical protein